MHFDARQCFSNARHYCPVRERLRAVIEAAAARNNALGALSGPVNSTVLPNLSAVLGDDRTKYANLGMQVFGMHAASNGSMMCAQAMASGADLAAVLQAYPLLASMLPKGLQRDSTATASARVAAPRLSGSLSRQVPGDAQLGDPAGASANATESKAPQWTAARAVFEPQETTTLDSSTPDTNTAVSPPTWPSFPNPEPVAELRKTPSHGKMPPFSASSTAAGKLPQLLPLYVTEFSREIMPSVSTRIRSGQHSVVVVRKALQSPTDELTFPVLVARHGRAPVIMTTLQLLLHSKGTHASVNTHSSSSSSS
jgi:hypothetical protein